ncbi:hypothetical protein AVEN_101405-1 [Araneus ventricosus]|uniref:Uncharacterized protein n=1 Tax=Araneus ventricosus TaxID=182803 RepID=A0A4Y2LDZ0_ARAVE|nr:hypothetical protein AVEN_101405-1 [Araneus ventricosus]
MLTKKGTLNGSPYPDVELPWSHIKAHFSKLMMGKKEWEEGETGRLIFNIIPNVKSRPNQWREEIILFTVHGPFGANLKRFNLASSRTAAVEELVPTSIMPLNASSQNRGILKDQNRSWKIFGSKGRIQPALQE